MKRPPEPTTELEGYAYVAEPAPTEGWHRWSADPWIVEGRRCRYGSRTSGWCHRPAIAVLDRGREATGWRSGTSPRWWGYCGRHMYGRWVEDDVVFEWHLRKEES